MKIFGLYFVWRGGTIMQALSNAARGTYTIQWMFVLPEVLKQLQEWQICEGSMIQVIAKYKHALLIGSNSRRFIIDNEIADRIRV